jgi:Ras-related protein Rab-1A
MPREFIFKIVLVGNGASGKTSLVLQYTEHKFSENYIMSIGANFAIHLIQKPEEDIAIRLQLWDLAGQKHFTFVRPSFYRGAFAIIYIFDLTLRESFEAIKGWKDEAERHTGDIPRLLLGNKVDLTEHRVISKKEGEQLAEEIGAMYFETSAKDAINVDQAFLDITDTLMKKHIDTN